MERRAEAVGPGGPTLRSVVRTPVLGRAVAMVGLCLAWARAEPGDAQERLPLPLVQSELADSPVEAMPLTLRDASRDDRWLGMGARDVRWAPGGSVAYFRWHSRPEPGDLEEEDPWFRVDADGTWAERLPDSLVSMVPSPSLSWSRQGDRAAWVNGESLIVFDPDRSPAVRTVVRLGESLSDPVMDGEGGTVTFQAGGGLYAYQLSSGRLALVARQVAESGGEPPSRAGAWLREEQRQLLEYVQDQEERERARAAHSLRVDGGQVQPIPLPPEAEVDQLRRSPDGRFLTFRARFPAAERPPTRYMDYLDASGYSRALDARSKVGEARDRFRLGVVTIDPAVPTDSVAVRWVELHEAGEQVTVPHGPFWNLEGTRAVAQFIGEDHQDLWYAEVDLETGSAKVLAHDHDGAWIGGPPVQANYLGPALMEWLHGDRLVFASERSGWSHLYRLDPDGTVTALTEGPWEVRDARLSRDRTKWLIQASREHPGEDHLYVLPAAGGDLVRITEGGGRHVGRWSPDGRRLAVLSDDATHMPDLFLRSDVPGDMGRRVTVSGADAFYRVRLRTPEIVSFPHPDGDPLWAAVYRPDDAVPGGPALIHVHGGGYRQFAHRGWSVYGYGLHLGFLHYMVEQGYTVLDFDYRGSAGYGRGYRTDIARSMGVKDVDGAVSAAEYLVEELGVDPARIGMYGVSYGGFMTLMSQFRYPGVFKAGIARAAVTDWAHYSDGWTSRILGIPDVDAEAYRLSSPIYHAEGLEDRLLITHGLVDDNVHFQDAARLIQRLIELEKEFEVMVYPGEPHTVETEAGRYDLVRRSAAFFERWLGSGR